MDRRLAGCSPTGLQGVLDCSNRQLNSRDQSGLQGRRAPFQSSLTGWLCPARIWTQTAVPVTPTWTLGRHPRSQAGFLSCSQKLFRKEVLVACSHTGPHPPGCPKAP